MDKHTFSKLPLIFSMDNDIFELLKSNEQENKRVTDIEEKRSEKLKAIENFNEALATKNELLLNEEKELEQVEDEIAKAVKASGIAKTEQQLNAANKSIETHTIRKGELENTVFSLLEDIEQLEDNIASAESFLEGSKKSLAEIKDEVTENLKYNQNKINELEGNINELLDAFKGSDRELLDLTRKQFRFKKPLALIDGIHCSVCAGEIDRITIAEVEKQSSIVLCPHCRRILSIF